MQTKDFRGMPHRRMGNSGLWVSEVGLGLWKWGDPSYDGSRVGQEEGFKILDRALELGVTHWDTANSYNQGAGNSERLIGRYFESRDPRIRDTVVLATKVRNAVRAEGERTREFSPNERGASRKYVLQAVEGSLRRLKTDYIDILYHHAPVLLEDGNYETPLDEMWDAFDTLVQQGKVRYVAVSNRTIEQLEADRQALAAVNSNPARRIIAVQNWYNILQRPRVSAYTDGATVEDEQAFLDYLIETGIGLVPYVPLAVGLLTGRYHKGNLDPSGRLSQEDWAGEFLTQRNLELVDELEGIAEDKGCTLAQLAIAWLLAHDAVCSVIAGVTKLSHLEENAQAPNYGFTATEMAKLDDLTRFEEEEEESD
ncbi:MAG: aldo/keto reductase [Anaerolineae bacterium]